MHSWLEHLLVKFSPISELRGYARAATMRFLQMATATICMTSKSVLNIFLFNHFPIFYQLQMYSYHATDTFMQIFFSLLGEIIHIT